MTAERPLYSHAQLSRMLNAKSIAIIGASARPGAFGERVLVNLVSYTGNIYLVNARYETIGDRKCYPSVTALPESVDVAVIVTARDAVEGVMEECIKAKVGGVIIFASGYSETGKPEHAALQARLGELAQGSGVPIIGPNCIGTVNYELQSRISFMPYSDMPIPAPGTAIGVISQSGALGFGLEQALQRGVPISHVLTSGNSVDVDMADYIMYLADEPAVGAIALLFEGTAQPMRVMKACEYAFSKGIPVAVCKIAVGELGGAAAMSHTGSLAGSQAAYRTAFARAGAVLVDEYTDLMETAHFLCKAPKVPQAFGLAVLASSGGAAIMAADAAEAYGIPLPQARPETKEILEARIPEFGSTVNPVDVTAQVMNDPECIPACARAMAADDTYGAILIPAPYSSAAGVLRVPLWGEIARESGKPIIHAWISDWLQGPTSAELTAEPGVLVVRSMDRAMANLAAWHWLAARRVAPARKLVTMAKPGAKAAAAKLLAAGTGTLTERQSKEIFALYDIPVVQEKLATSADQAASLALSMGLPSVLKIESPDLPHKTEAGVIRLNLKSEADVRAAYAEVMANAAKVSPPPRVNGVLVQPMVPTGVEIMIGARVDPLFGPLIVVGLGGIFVELMKDTAVGLAPVTQTEALGMLDKLKGQAMLNGFRNLPAVDRDALAAVVVRVAEFIADHCDQVAEIDVNPLICAGGRILAVDALIVKA
jgi:acyl-CoA synthetase (NDP forming)